MVSNENISEKPYEKRQYKSGRSLRKLSQFFETEKL